MVAMLLVLALQAGSDSGSAPPSLLAELKAMDQAMLDAVSTGDRSVWERTLTPDAIYVDENGSTHERSALLAELQPLPAGISGEIRIVDYKVRQLGDTALVIHRDEEHENFHGQALVATYLTTGTWVRHEHKWKLAMVHVYAVNVDPPSITLKPAELDEYAGRYSAAPDLAFVISREGDHLVGGREGRAAKPLGIEIRDVLFVPGQPRTRKLFQRDAQGRVTGFVDRREGEDIHWTLMH